MWPIAPAIPLVATLWSYMLFTLGFCRYSSLETTYITTPLRRRHDGRPERITYPPSLLKALRKSCPRSRLPDDLWNNLGERGIRKPVRSRRKRTIRNVSASVVEQDQLEAQNTTSRSSFATVPDIFMANVGSLQLSVHILMLTFRVNG